MDIKKFEQEYNDFIKDYGEEQIEDGKVVKKQGHIHQAYVKEKNEKIEHLNAKLTYYKGEKKEAEELGKKPGITQQEKFNIQTNIDLCDLIIKDTEDEIKKIQAELTKKKKEYEKRKEKCEKAMEEIKKDPAIANKMNDVLPIKLDRKMAKIEQRKEKTGDEKKDAELIANVLREVPILEEKIKKTMKISKNKQDKVNDIILEKRKLEEIKKKIEEDTIKALKKGRKLNNKTNAEKKQIIKKTVEEALKNNKDYNDQMEVVSKKQKVINGIDNELVKYEKEIASTVKGVKGVDLKNIDDVITRMTDNSTRNYGTNAEIGGKKVKGSFEVPLEECMKMTLASYNRELVGIEKQLEANKVAFAKLDVTVEKPKSEAVKKIGEMKKDIHEQKVQNDIKTAKENKKEELKQEEQARRQALMPADKPKWWHFIKRHRYNRQLKQYIEAIQTPLDEAIKDRFAIAEEDIEKKYKEEEAKEAAEKSKPTMKEALKYNIVKKVLEQEQSSKLKEAKKTIKEANNKEKEDEER